MISMHTHDIKHAEADKLKSEVEAFLANGGKKERSYVYRDVDGISKMHSKRYSEPYYVEQRKLRKEQQAVLQEWARSVNSKTKWKKLSDLIGGEVTATMLAHTNRGDAAIKNPEAWAKVVETINKELSK